jgi:hypothetical protein
LSWSRSIATSFERGSTFQTECIRNILANCCTICSILSWSRHHRQLWRLAYTSQFRFQPHSILWPRIYYCFL